jgi:hypothetical protein
MEIRALRSELDDLKVRHGYAVSAALILCNQLEKLALKVGNE